jgi:hypothetical protein
MQTEPPNLAKEAQRMPKGRKRRAICSGRGAERAGRLRGVATCAGPSLFCSRDPRPPALDYRTCLRGTASLTARLCSGA